MTEGRLRAFQFIEGGARYGAAVSLVNVAEGMRDREVDVEFGVFQGKPLGDALRERAFPVHEIPARKRFDLRGLRYLVRFFREQRFDVVHTHLSKATILGSLAGRLTHTPVVATVHGMNRKYTYMLASHLMTVSEAARRHLVDQGIPASRITAVYNGIDVEPFQSRPAKEDAKLTFGFDPKRVVIGTVARAHKQKGVDLSLQAVAELRRRGIFAQYLFVGDGPHLEDFKTLVSELDIADDVRFPGFSDSIVPALAAMDVFMFPTQREAFGISLLEAMAAEVPVVASAVDGVPEVLADGAGQLVSSPTPEALADAAQRLITDDDFRAQTIDHARRRVTSVFSTSAVAGAVEQVYRKTIRVAQLGAKAAIATRPDRYS